MAIKGVILAAGYGTRFLPVTRCVPKEMLPIVDRPALDYIVQEFIDAGIEDLLLISSHRKGVMEHWFQPDQELNDALERVNKPDLLAKAAPPKIRTEIVHQQQMRGTGDALMLAREFAGSDPVIVAFPDDLFGEPNCSKQLIEAYQSSGASVLSVADFSGRDVSRYGVVDGELEDRLIRVRGVVEKPPRGSEPSHWVSLGRYLYTPEFWAQLERFHQAFDGAGEFYPMDAMNALAKSDQLVAAVIDAPRYDTGQPLEYLKSMVSLALRRPDLGEEFRAWLSTELDVG